MHCVIGSGPAGVACAKALLARGATVLMLDAGLELEPDRVRLVRELASVKPPDWQPGQLSKLKEGMTAGASGIPLKLFFGSDFPYRETETLIPWQSQGTSVRPSLALGGLSNTWGAAMLPYCAADIADWPIKIADLEPHYRAAAKITGLAAELDTLAERFPLYCDDAQPLPPSRQADRLLDSLNRHRAGLRARGWHFGRARVAVRARDIGKDIGCVRCGLCMYGCPYSCIYNSADTVRELRAGKKFSYQRDVIVTSLRESSGKVVIEGFHRQTRAPLSFEAHRAYLAAGVIPTAQVLLRSQAAYDHPLCLRDSQYFLLPFLLARRTREVETELLYTLSQAFIEICNPQVSRHTVHLQIYTYSDLIGQAVRQSLGPLKFLARPLVGRMLIVQGYLHSDESRTIEMTLKRNGAKDCLHLNALPNPETRRTVKRVVREMLRQSRRLGGIVLPPMLQLAEPGRGFHCAGSFPMRENPQPFESDCLGRPHGWTRVHAVDATVLPGAPATTITFSVMANAHRIGWETAKIP
jgi:ferredoxin